MKIGIISDSHDQIKNIRFAVTIFNKEKVGLVYHLGDLCSPFTLQLYSVLKCRIKVVFGNNDSDIYRHLAWKPKNMQLLGKFYVDTIDNKKICLYHGDPNETVVDIFSSGRYDVLLTGHNHCAEIKDNGKTLLINPGNLIGPFSDKTISWTKPSVAVYDSKKHCAKIILI